MESKVILELTQNQCYLLRAALILSWNGIDEIAPEFRDLYRLVYNRQFESYYGKI